VIQTTASSERKLGSLATKIDDGDCVLVLGPRIAAPRVVADTDIPIDEYLAAKLLEDLGDNTAVPTDLRHTILRYQREKSSSACRSLMQELASEFDDHTTDLHLDLASLPFRLILSATPDRMMARALRDKGKAGVHEAYYDYCRSAGTDLPLTLPTLDKPLVYSLFGRHDHPESMVMDDKNLLDYLVKITRESPALPDVVRATLRAPSTVFLFVGFGFTNWWLRLLLKVLDVTGVENRGLSLALEDKSTFEAAVSSEQTGFFESVGIYIQSRDWNAMAKGLAARIHNTTSSSKAASATPSATDGGQGTGRPLVFLSYASEDIDRISALRDLLQHRGISVWQDKQNLRAGQNWMDQIEHVIAKVDYFVFVQTDKMDARPGVYNRELKRALARVEDLEHGLSFLFHVTMGACQPRPEPTLKSLHHIAVDTDAGGEKLADDILASYQEKISRAKAPAALVN
jgi:hypothetical protein